MSLKLSGRRMTRSKRAMGPYLRSELEEYSFWLNPSGQVSSRSVSSCVRDGASLASCCSIRLLHPCSSLLACLSPPFVLHCFDKTKGSAWCPFPLSSRSTEHAKVNARSRTYRYFENELWIILIAASGHRDLFSETRLGRTFCGKPLLIETQRSPFPGWRRSNAT